MKKQILLTIISLASLAGFSQILYVPTNGTSTSNTSFVGIGTSSPNHPLYVMHPSLDLTSSGTNYLIGSSFDILNTYNIPSSNITESGYRMGVDINAYVNSANFLGTLSQQFGMRIQYGTYTGSATGTITNSYGLYLQGLESGNASITNKFGIYQTGANFKNYFAGNIGIGTTSPQAKLHVNGDVYFNLGEGLQIFGDNNYYGTNLDARIIRIIDGNDTGGNADGGVTFESYTSTDAISKGILTIRGNGNVGIGTTAPTQALTVKGTVLASKVQIVSDSEIPASDYVFNKDYNLPSLKDVEQFVNENKHLPEVPSAIEFKENGYSVGQMDDILLKKVEELTLYVIDLKKENEQQQGKLDEKDALIQEMLKRIEALEKK